MQHCNVIGLRSSRGSPACLSSSSPGAASSTTTVAGVDTHLQPCQQPTSSQTAVHLLLASPCPAFATVTAMHAKPASIRPALLLCFCSPTPQKKYNKEPEHKEYKPKDDKPKYGDKEESYYKTDAPEYKQGSKPQYPQVGSCIANSFCLPESCWPCWCCVCDCCHSTPSGWPSAVCT